MPFFGERRVCDIDRYAVDEFKAWMRRRGNVRACRSADGTRYAESDVIPLQHHARGPAGAPTINRALTVLSSILETAESWEMINRNPVRKAKRPEEETRQMRIYEPSEVLAIAEAMDHERDRAMVLFAAFTGLRQGEIRQLQWRDIDLERGWVQVRRGTNPDRTEKSVKTRHAREVPLFGPARAAIERWATHAPSARGLVFPNDEGAVIHKSNWIRRSWIAGCVQAGMATCPTCHLEIQKDRPTVVAVRKARWRCISCDGREIGAPTFHELRHTFVSMCAAASVPMAQSMLWAGHRSQGTHSKYTHLFTRQTDEAIARADALMSGWLGT